MKKVAIIHHSAIENNDWQFLKIDKIHERRWNWQTKSRLWFYVGYHFVIEKDWLVKQARLIDEIGAHCNTNIDWIKYKSKVLNPNYDTIGICLAGNFEKEEPTQEQLESLLKLLRELRIKRVYWHRDFKQTVCPGVNMYKYLNEVNDLINYSYKNIYETEKENCTILRNKKLAEKLASIDNKELYFLFVILLGRVIKLI